MNVIWLLVSYGFSLSGIREVSKTRARGELRQIFSQHFSARVVMAILGGVVGLIATRCSPLLSERPSIGVLATLLGIVAATNLGWLFQGLQRFRTPIMLEVAGFAISLALILSLVHGPADSIWVLASLLVSGLATSVIAYGLAIRDIGLPRIAVEGVAQLIVVPLSCSATRRVRCCLPLRPPICSLFCPTRSRSDISAQQNVSRVLDLA